MKVNSTFNENISFVNVDKNSIKGIWEIQANINNFIIYFLKFLVWTYPSVDWKAKMGNANLPIKLKEENPLKIEMPIWSKVIDIIPIIFNKKLVKLIT